MSAVTKRETLEGLPAENPAGSPGGGPPGRGRRPRHWPAAALCAAVAVVLAAWSVDVLAPDREEAVFTAEDGALPDDLSVTPFDTRYPSIARLDGALLEAVREAARDALEEGVVLHVTSGWRSGEYQQHLLDQAVLDHGSREEARRLVSTPEESRHVTGEAIDIGPTDAADWLVRRGSAYGLCQVYANEMWHFELLTEPGGDCPDLLSDAAG